MKGVHETRYVEGGEDGEDFFVRAGRYLLNLETLGYYIPMGYHDLFSVSIYPQCSSQKMEVHTAFGSPVVPELKLRNPQRSPLVWFLGI